MASSRVLGMLSAIMLCALWPVPVPASTAPSAPAADVPGAIAVEVLRDGSWIAAGGLKLGLWPGRRSLDLTALLDADDVHIRLRRTGNSPAYLDAVLLGDRGPQTSSDGGDIPGRLAEPDLDVVALEPGASMVLAFASGSAGPLEVLARVAPASQPVVPFTFPLDNLYLAPSSFRSFYRYETGSTLVRLTPVDGVFDSEPLGAPLFDVVTRPGSGHPTASTVAWVGDDGDTLYAAVDFLPDNTDETEDFATLHVRTPEGLRSFTISADDQRWGTGAFGPTRLAGYRHTTYEFAVPLAELGLGAASTGDPLELAFSLYGTVAPTALLDEFSAPTAGGQSVTSAACTLGLDDVPAPGSILGAERDMRVTAGTPTANVNVTAPGHLSADFSASDGTIELVYDGPDADCAVLHTAGAIGDLFSPGFDRIVLVDASNGGSADVQVRVTLFAESQPVRFPVFQSVAKTVPASSGPANVEFLYATDFTGLDPGLLAQTTAVVLEISAAAPGGVLTAAELVPSNGPVPVELQSFTVGEPY